MKKILLFGFLFVCLTASAQMPQAPKFGKSIKPQKTIEDWEGVVVPENTVIGVKFVLVDGIMLGGLSYKDRCDVDPGLVTDFDDMVGRGVYGATQYLGRYDIPTVALYFTTKTEGRDYLLTFYIKAVSDKGDALADASLTTPDGTKTVLTDLYGKGGRYGSFVNLMGDGFESLGGEFVRYIAWAMNKGKVKMK